MILIRRGSATPGVLKKGHNSVLVSVGLKAVGADRQARLSYSTKSTAVTIAAASKSHQIKEAAGTTDVSQTVTVQRRTSGPALVIVDVAVAGAMPDSWPVSVSVQ